MLFLLFSCLDLQRPNQSKMPFLLPHPFHLNLLSLNIELNNIINNMNAIRKEINEITGIPKIRGWFTCITKAPATIKAAIIIPYASLLLDLSISKASFFTSVSSISILIFPLCIFLSASVVCFGNSDINFLNFDAFSIILPIIYFGLSLSLINFSINGLVLSTNLKLGSYSSAIP